MGRTDMEHPAVRSRKKLDKVYVLMSRQTRARLKLIAGFKSMQLFDLLDTLCSDFIQGWEKHTKVDLDKLQGAESKRQLRNTAKASRSRV